MKPLPLTIGIGGGLSYAAIARHLSTGLWKTSFAMAGVPVVGYGLYKSVRVFSELDKRVHQLRMGGEPGADQTAALYRKKALRELSDTVTSSRQFLGREALMMRQ